MVLNNCNTKTSAETLLSTKKISICVLSTSNSAVLISNLLVDERGAHLPDDDLALVAAGPEARLTQVHDAPYGLRVAN